MLALGLRLRWRHRVGAKHIAAIAQRALTVSNRVTDKTRQSRLGRWRLPGQLRLGNGVIHQQQRIVAAGAEPRGRCATLATKLLDRGCVVGIVKRGKAVRRLGPLRGDLVVAGAAVARAQRLASVEALALYRLGHALFIRHIPREQRCQPGCPGRRYLRQRSAWSLRPQRPAEQQTERPHRHPEPTHGPSGFHLFQW